MKLIKVAAASVNQTPLDWVNNTKNIQQALQAALEDEVSILCFPELAVSGWECGEAFSSPEVARLSLEMLASVAPCTKGVIATVGLPFLLGDHIYDSAALLVDGEIAGFAAKSFFSNISESYLGQWFTPWEYGKFVEIQVFGKRCPFGHLIFDCSGVKVAFEMCDEDWRGPRPVVQLAYQGAEIILNPCARQFSLGCYQKRQHFVAQGSQAFGTVYIYANPLGNESGRRIYDGGSLIASSGKIVGKAERFSFKSFALTTAVIDLDRNRANRMQNRACAELPQQELQEFEAGRVKRSFAFNKQIHMNLAKSSTSWEDGKSVKEEELIRALALGLFDCLRKQNNNGFLLYFNKRVDALVLLSVAIYLVKLGVHELGIEEFKKKLLRLTQLQSCESIEEIIRKLVCIVSIPKNENQRLMLSEVLSSLGFDHCIMFGSDNWQMFRQASGNQARGCETGAESHSSIQAYEGILWTIAGMKNLMLLSAGCGDEAPWNYEWIEQPGCFGFNPIAGVEKGDLRELLDWLEQKGPDGVGVFPELSSFKECYQKGLEPEPSSNLVPFRIFDFINQALVDEQQQPVEILKEAMIRFPENTPQQLSSWIEQFVKLWMENQDRYQGQAVKFAILGRFSFDQSQGLLPLLNGRYLTEIDIMKEYLKTVEV